MQDRQR